MTEFSWLDELATRDPEQPLLLAPSRIWRAGAVRGELLAMTERLHSCRVLGVLADNSPAWVIAALGAEEAGIVHLPLPGFFSPEQLRHALEQGGADRVLTDQPERIGALDLGFSITGHWQGLTWLRRHVAAVELPAGTAKISFTSGSTGTPKGVCLSRQGLLETARAVRDRLADLPLERHLAVLPLALLLEDVAGVHAPLLRGLPVQLLPLAQLGWRGMAGFDPQALDAAVAAAGASSLILVPELLKAWTAFLTLSGRRPAATLQFVAVGGARVAPELVEAARRLGIPAYQGYGLTEAGSVLTLNRPGDDGDAAGRPLAHARLSLVDGEVVAHTSTFLGYAGHAGGASSDGFRTGDLGDFDARGHLQLSGRRSNLLITSFGRNISPEWPEALLLADPGILQAVVVGDGQPALGAIIVARPGLPAAAVDAAVARANAGLPDYARIAWWIASEPFSTANGMATGNGRPVRRRIAECHAAAITARGAHEETQDAVL